MANSYLQFSFEVPVPKSLHAWVENVLNLMSEVEYDNAESVDPYLKDIFKESLEDEYQCIDFDVEYDGDNLWFYAQEYGDIGQVSNFLSALLLECYAAGEDLNTVGFTYAGTCSKMRLNQFSGGYHVVKVRDGIVEQAWGNAYESMLVEMGPTAP